MKYVPIIDRLLSFIWYFDCKLSKHLMSFFIKESKLL